MIRSDASLAGWGAVCRKTPTGGLWSPLEQGLHINGLELKAATLALPVIGHTPDRDIGITVTGQPDSISVQRPLGGTVSPQPTELAKGSMAVGSLQESHVGSSAHSGIGQSDSRFGVQRVEGLLGLEVVPSSISENQYNLGTPRGGPVCISPILLPTTLLLQLEARSSGRSYEYLSTGLAPSESICKSPMVPDCEGPEPSKDPTGSGGANTI